MTEWATWAIEALVWLGARSVCVFVGHRKVVFGRLTMMLRPLNDLSYVPKHDGYCRRCGKPL